MTSGKKQPLETTSRFQKSSSKNSSKTSSNSGFIEDVKIASGTTSRPEDWPLWYFPDSPLGSAVRYIASLSSKFNWVGVYVLKGNVLELGPFLGEDTPHTRIPIGRGVCGTAVAENRDINVPSVAASDNYLACSLKTRSELVVLIRDGAGKILGQIDIDSHIENAFGPEEEKSVQRVAQQLGELWPG